MTACTGLYAGSQIDHGLQVAGLRERTIVSRNHNWALPRRSNIYISFPVLRGDSHATHPYLASQIASTLEHTVSLQFQSCISASREEGGSRIAMAPNADFVFRPEVSFVEDKYNTFFAIKSGNVKRGKDRITITIKVYDAKSDNLLDTIRVKTTAGLFRSNGDHPSSLLSSTFSAVVTSL